ncbi:hypothetical protein HKX48_008486 [Thoreauomyces humboldtii]|nr:hypothetical protein HKX48_008486 [Thoreauomyces humboldtii]
MAVRNAQQADALSPQADAAWPFFGPTILFNRRAQVRKITSFDPTPTAEIPLTLEISDKDHSIDCIVTNECVHAYNALREASLACPNPSLTTLRGAILILTKGRFRFSRHHPSRPARVCLVVESFVFVGNHGCEPTQSIDHLADWQGVVDRLALLGAWMSPVRAPAQEVIEIDIAQESSPPVNVIAAPPPQNRPNVSTETSRHSEFNTTVDATFLGEWDLQLSSDEDEECE